MRKLASFLCFFPAMGFGQLALKDQLPPWAAKRWTTAAGQLQVDVSGRINPFFQRGDFDGDGRPDLAVLVQGKANRKVGILILHRNGGRRCLAPATPSPMAATTLSGWIFGGPKIGVRYSGVTMVL